MGGLALNYHLELHKLELFQTSLCINKLTFQGILYALITEVEAWQFNAPGFPQANWI